jgi:hypothetical protein
MPVLFDSEASHKHTHVYLRFGFIYNSGKVQHSWPLMLDHKGQCKGLKSCFFKRRKKRLKKPAKHGQLSQKER